MNTPSFNTKGEVKGEVASSGKASSAADPPLSELDALQLLLDLGGMVPGAGAIADLLNAAISAARGDWLGMALSIFSAAPAVGDAAALAKIAKNAPKYAEALAVVEAKVLPKLPDSIAKPLKDFIGKAKAKLDEMAGAKKEPPKKEPESPKGGNDTQVKARGMKKHEVRCFKKNDKGDPDEYDRQLADQEKGLNDLSVKDYLEGRQRFEDIGRKGTGAEQAKARAAYGNELAGKYKAQLNKQGITGQAAQDQAAKMAADKMSTLAALHNPDMIAGGKDVVTSIGDKGVNSSIGAQWKDRVADLDKAARDIPESERGNTKMNAKLKRCK